MKTIILGTKDKPITMVYVGKSKDGADVYKTNIWAMADIRLDPAKHQVRMSK